MGYLTGTMPDADRSAQGSVRLAEVFATPSAPEAEVVRGLLEAGDIPVVVKGMSQSPYRMGATYLLVPEDLEVQARALIEEARSEGGGVADWQDQDANR